MKEFLIRTVFATIYATVIICSVWWNTAIFGVIIGIVTILGVREVAKLLSVPTHTLIEMCLIACCVPLYGYFLVVQHSVCEQYIKWIFIGLLLLFLISELFFEKTNPIKNWGVLLGTIGMVLLPFVLLIDISNESKRCLLALFITIWVNDSGAYCIGKVWNSLGHTHKLFPRVSPNKTWEGLIGGILCAVLCGVVLEHFHWVERGWLFGLIVAFFGSIGDLMESLFKRTVGVKDSGIFMPGHGGVLDRFDSVMLATVIVYIVYYCF